MTANNPNGDEQRLRQHLINFYSVLEEKLKSYRDTKKHLDRFLSTDFNVFEWIKLNKKFESNENRLSEIILSKIIASLLNPSGSHGQDRKFLDAFLHLDEIRRHIKPNDLDSLLKQRPLSVTCESYTVYIENSRRRIDILVDFENFGLGIENKLWAVDQEKQVQDYSNHLKKRYKGKFCLLYLTPERGDPDESSILSNCREELKQNGKLICISYRHDILKWIEECCRLCESDRFRWFLRDFKDYIPTILQEGPMNDSIERNLILDHALENKKNLEIALDINSAFNGDLHGQIITGFLHKLEKFVLHKLSQRHDGSQWEVNNKTLLDSPLPQYADFSFGRKSWGPRCGVGLQLQPPKDNEDRVRKVIIGVWKPEDDLWPSELEERLRNELNRRLGRNVNRSTKGWPWYFYLNDDPYANWNGKDALIKLYNGHEAVEYFGQYLVDIIEGAEQFIGEHVGTS